jgi:glycine C-acetyltransferase
MQGPTQNKQQQPSIADIFGKKDGNQFNPNEKRNPGLFDSHTPTTAKDEEDETAKNKNSSSALFNTAMKDKINNLTFTPEQLEEFMIQTLGQLKKAQNQRFRIIVTDGVFSMDGDIAKMNEICDLADKYDALVMTDECHSAGFIGKTGRGVPEYHNCMERVDIITGTLGKALGGAMGGYTTGKKEIIELLRQRSRPYLFSNSLSPAIVGASNKVFEILSETTELRDKLEFNTQYFKERIIAAGFDIKPGEVSAFITKFLKLKPTTLSTFILLIFSLTPFHFFVGVSKLSVSRCAGRRQEQIYLPFFLIMFFQAFR